MRILATSLGLALILGLASPDSRAAGVLGEARKMGAGEVRSYAELDASGKPPQDFTHTWIYGAYDGHITFYESMITRAFLLGRPDLCAPIRQPAAWERSGFYPTEYCMRFDDAGKGTRVSLEGLVHRVGE